MMPGTTFVDCNVTVTRSPYTLEGTVTFIASLAQAYDDASLIF